MIADQYYSLLGKYLYALALSDGTVQKKEMHVIDHYVKDKSESLRVDNKIDNARNLLVLKVSFYNGIETKPHLSTICREFENFLMKYSSKLTDTDKEIAIELAEKIIESFGGIAEEEEKLWAKIRPMLN